MSAPPSWYADVYAELRRGGVEFMYTVPDEALGPLLETGGERSYDEARHADDRGRRVAACCGAWLGGKASCAAGAEQRRWQLHQRVHHGFQLPLPDAAVSSRCAASSPRSIRGKWPWGASPPECLELSGFEVWWARSPAEIVDLVAGGIRMAWRAEKAIAILFSQRLVGAKDI